MDETRPTQTGAVAAFRAADRAPSLADSALAYARSGIPVFPCVPGCKPPLTGAGYRSATTDVARVEAWWRARPDANIGIPTGAVSGLDVVDIDIHGGASGRPTFERARDAHLVDGWAWSVQTPSGGLHVYYPHDRAVAQRCWTTSSHVDFRGDGGYVIAPPSRIVFDRTHSAAYVLGAVSTEPAHAIDATALRRFIDPPRPPRPTPGLIPGRGGSIDRLVDWVGRRGPGTRNSGLFWAACEMARHGYTHDVALSSLGPAALKAGLDEREIRVTVGSAYDRQPPLTSSQPPARPSAREGVSL
ncbi:DNA replication protein [Xylanimonas allomyrinae]|uniref:DNA replication protein n=1 Tax=Xylanimonas allomyrinae TaxID=2509459 RepID=A0A4P6ELI8_9MICO|nr:bifunctional DNA primase/polymerase [Xylanimonas allomyrinae]QAY63534.1 DNA replication protein [Xylanimonas allomyrinae]